MMRLDQFTPIFIIILYLISRSPLSITVQSYEVDKASRLNVGHPDTQEVGFRLAQATNGAA